MPPALRLTQPKRLAVASAGSKRGMVRATATATSKVPFSKFQGCGNDFILIDNRTTEEPCVSPKQAAKLCDRNFGVGGDGVIFALPPVGDTEYTMRIYNSDGSEPEMCGNGIRCLAKFVSEIDNAPPGKCRVHTLAGVMVPEVRDDGLVTVDMGEPILVPADVPTTLRSDNGDDSAPAVRAPLTLPDGQTFAVTCVSMGNPHCIAFVDDEVYNKDGSVCFDLAGTGPQVEGNAAFPARTNAEFAKVRNRALIDMVVYERGAGPTLACGTGACATVVAGLLEGVCDRVCDVRLPGGTLSIEWRESDNRIYMTGPGDRVFGGELAL